METTVITTSADKLVIQEAVRDWCRFPYPGHPKGCPNYGKRPTCPPQAPRLDKFFDLSMPVCFIIVKFDLAEHAERMKRKHPEFTERQARCCLYWQNTVRKYLGEMTFATMRRTNYSRHTDIPEAMGLNLFRTMHNVGIVLERNPKRFVHKIAMLGTAGRATP